MRLHVLNSQGTCRLNEKVYSNIFEYLVIIIENKKALSLLIY